MAFKTLSSWLPFFTSLCRPSKHEQTPESAERHCGKERIKPVRVGRRWVRLQVLEYRLLLSTTHQAYEVAAISDALQGLPSYATGINNSGAVIGNSVLSLTEAPYYGFLYENGSATALFTEGGWGTWPFGINDNGQVVGNSDNFAFLYNGSMINLGTLLGYDPQSGTYLGDSQANAINKNGLIVGQSLSNTGEHAFVYDGKMHDLGTLGGLTSDATGVNNYGSVVGYSDTADGHVHAFLLHDGSVTDLGTLPGDSESVATGINASGQVIGYSYQAGTKGYHAFLYSGGSMHYLFLGQATGINDAGDVVGYSEAVGGAETAFLYTQGRLIPLDSLIDSSAGWHVGEVHGINNKGQIAGTGGTNAFTTAVLLTPTPATTTITVGSSGSPTYFGQTITFHATVTANATGAGTPVGSVDFYDDGSWLGSCDLDIYGYASITPDNGNAGLSGGTHDITAVFSPSSTDFRASSSDAFSQDVQPDATTTTIMSSGTPSIFGQSVGFTATVTSNESIVGPPTGWVDFYDGDSLLGLATLNNGEAIWVTPEGNGGLALGTHTVRAVYEGTTDFLGSASGDFTQEVRQYATKTTVLSSINPSVFGQVVTFDATVTSGMSLFGPPTGVVRFFDGANLLGSASLDMAGRAAFATSRGDLGLAAGSHVITAIYGGDLAHATSTSRPLTQTVRRAQTKLIISSSIHPSEIGHAVTFTATVTAKTPGAGMPTGEVRFFDGDDLLGVVDLDKDGKTSFTTGSGLAALDARTHAIKAVYVGDHNFLTSTGTLSQLVQQPTHLVFDRVASPVAAGQIIPEVTVRVEDAWGKIVTDDNSSVTIALSESSNSALLGGILSVQVQQGVATFSDLSLTVAGKYTFTATDAALKAAQSNSFNISPEWASAHLVLTQQPAVTPVGRLLEPKPLIEIQDQYGNLVTTDHTRVNLAIVDGPIGGTFLGTPGVDPAKGVAAFSNVALALAGSYTLQATDAKLPITTPVQFSVTLAKGLTTIAPPVTAASYTFGQTITLTSTLKSDALSTLPFNAAATVTDQDGINLGSAAINAGGRVKFVLTGLSPSYRSCKINYPGDANHTATSSAEFVLQIKPAATTTELKPSVTHLVFGQPLTLSATVGVASGTGTPRTGIVTFFDGATVLGTAPLDGGSVATFSLPSAPAIGPHEYSASYGGDGNFMSSASARVARTVTKDAVALDLIPSIPAPISVGVSFSLTARVTVKNPGAGTPSGLVTFKDGAKLLGTAMVDSSGGAILTGVSFSSGGTHSVTASYAGDLNDDLAVSLALKLLVT